MTELGAAWRAAMLEGDFARAWGISDLVLEARDKATRDDPAQPYHLRWVWDGSDLRGRQVLVRCYHGLGDTLQFARYLAPLRAIAASVTLEVQPELCGLLGGMHGVDRVLPFRTDAPALAEERDIEIMELAYALRLRPEAVAAPYLLVPRAAALPAIGLCWRAGNWDSARSIPLHLLAPIFARGRLASLQPGELPAPGATACPATIEETAALVAGLRLVVTVDSMVAHLAGALGRPCWLLLKHEADWRWMRDRADSPWYPSVRLFRQAAPGNWQSVVSQLAAVLAK